MYTNPASVLQYLFVGLQIQPRGTPKSSAKNKSSIRHHRMKRTAAVFTTNTQKRHKPTPTNILEHKSPSTTSSQKRLCDEYTHDPVVGMVAPDYDPIHLAKQTPHILDDSIQFEEDEHRYSVVYTLDKDRPGVEPPPAADIDRKFSTEDGILSTSGVVHSYFPHFDPTAVIKKMRRGRNFHRSQYKDMTDQEIQNLWSENGRKASARGTLLHFLLECHNNGFDLKASMYAELSDVQSYFQWREKHFVGLVPFRTEMRMRTGIDLRITGTADLLAVDANHPPPDQCGGVLSLHLIDWKFSKQIKYENPYENGSGPCSGMNNCNYEHYNLQQNIYQWMLETYYNDWEFNGHTYTKVRIVSRHLAVFHSNHPGGYLYIELPESMESVEAIMADRRKKVQITHSV